MKMQNKERPSFTNARMFALVMQNEEFCKGLLERILGRSIDELLIRDKLDISSEETIIAAIDSKSVRLDVRFTDDRSWYCIEMQVRDTGYIPERSGYYHSIMAVKDLDTGDEYEDLKPSYVIFLCCFDPMGKGKARYTFEMYDRENELSLGEKRYTILLNSKAKEMPAELKGLFEYMNEGRVEASDNLLSHIDEAVNNYADGKVGRTIMKWEHDYEREIRILKEEKAESDARAEAAEKAKAELDARIEADEARIAELEALIKELTKQA